MDVVTLSRLQFAAAVFFHFIFVPLTLGLSVLIAIIQTRYYRSGDEQFKRMAKFWGKLFLINFALGVVTGITLEFQFGTNWAQYSKYVGDVFGSLLALEATMAFFLESTFIAVWHFGWDRISKKIHLLSIWLVALAGNISAIWIILANGWMQNPVGSTLRNGRQELESFDGFMAILTNPFAWSQILHMLFAAMMLGGFFMMGISAWHLMRKNEVDFFTRSFKMGAVTALLFAVLLPIQGHHHGTIVARMQPSKLAAMESQWETGTHVPMHLLIIPDEKNERNLVEAFAIPGFLSFLAHGDVNAKVIGLKDYPRDERPPVLLTFASFRMMVGLGTLFPVLAALALFWRSSLHERRWFGWALILTIPLPYAAIMAGWTVAEVGRQPWIVWGIMKTRDAVSPVAASSVGLSLLAFIGLYGALGLVAVWLLQKYARLGPPADPRFDGSGTGDGGSGASAVTGVTGVTGATGEDAGQPVQTTS